MSDPFRLFADATDGQQMTLKAVWPALHDCLARLDEPETPRVLRCAVYVTHPVGFLPHRPATARLTENGHPACDECIAEACDIPTGYPLKRATPTS